MPRLLAWQSAALLVAMASAQAVSAQDAAGSAAPAAQAGLSSLADDLRCSATAVKVQGTDFRTACLRGNSLKDGFGYWYNHGRGTDDSVCQDDCWCCRRDLSLVPQANSWSLAAKGTSCRNWRRIQMFRTTAANTSFVCGLLCKANRGCVHFAYIEQEGCSEAGVSEQGSCMLLFGECDRQPSSCWNLYSMSAEPSASPQLAAPMEQPVVAVTTVTTTTVLTTEPPEGFRFLIDGERAEPDRMLLPESAVDENLCELAGNLDCAAELPTRMFDGDARSACLLGNALKDGRHYVFNSARGTDLSCGDCSCCVRDTSAVPETKSYLLKARGASCRNWRHIQMFRPVAVNSSSTCSRLCAANRGCVQFAYLSADQCAEGGVSQRGSCMLFSGACERQASSCWDLYAMQTAQPPGAFVAPSHPLPQPMVAAKWAVQVLPKAEYQPSLRGGNVAGAAGAVLAALAGLGAGLAVASTALRWRGQTRSLLRRTPSQQGGGWIAAGTEEPEAWRTPSTSMLPVPGTLL